MTTSLFPVRPEHVPTLGRICFEAFSALQDRHGVERDFQSAAEGEMLVGLFSSQPCFAGFSAMDVDRASDEYGGMLGSNFLMFPDAVAAVGPITVRPDRQAGGVGRLLMLAVMNEADRRGITQVRLQQEAINTASLSLYTKLGFDWREGCVMMRPNPAAADHPAIRPMSEADLPAVEAISTRHYHSSRRNEVAWLLKVGMPAFVMERGGGVSGYSLPGLLGHGFAERAEDLAELVVHASRHAPPPMPGGSAPGSPHDRHGGLPAGGCRAIKLLNYMTAGAYEAPRGAWMPSIGM